MTEKHRKIVIIWVCQRCGHEWQSRHANRPLRCAGCKRANWWVKSLPRGGWRGGRKYELVKKE